MAHRGIIRAVTGLAAGALLTTPLAGPVRRGLGWPGAPFLPYSVFEWLIRVLPGGLVTFGLDITLGALRGLGLDVAETAKTAEQVLAVITLFLAGLVVGLLFFVLVRGAGRRRIQVYGAAVGAVLGAFSAATALTRGPGGAVGQGRFRGAGIGALPAVGMGARPAPCWRASRARRWQPRRSSRRLGPRLRHLPASPAPAAGDCAISRRRFIIQMGGLVATIIVAGEAVAQVVGPPGDPAAGGPAGGPIAFPNSDSPVTAGPRHPAGVHAGRRPLPRRYRSRHSRISPRPTSGWPWTGWSPRRSR